MKRNQICTEPRIADEVKRLLQLGWAFECPGAHGKLRDPDGRFAAAVPISPKGQRAAANFIAQVRRHARSTGAAF